MTPAELPLVTIITDRASVPEEELMARLERSPVPLLVQLRDKGAAWVDRFALGRRLMASIGAHRLVVNGDLELALELGAHGLHLPAGRASELPAMRVALGVAAWLTVACHDGRELLQAAQLGADAALYSPIFASPGKGAPLGPAALEGAREELDRRGSRCRLIALGGVDASNASDCLRAGADGVAAIRADLVPWLLATALASGARR